MTAIVKLRSATLADASLLFEWVNAADSLRQKEHTALPIPWSHHCDWLERTLAEPRNFLFVVECDGVPVGQIRLEARDDGHIVDIYIVARARHRGIANAALSQAIRHSGVDRAVARVKEGNIASQNLFKALGFSATKRSDGIVTYEKSQRTHHAR